MGKFDGIQHFCFTHFAHFTFNHKDVVVGGSNDDLNISFLELRESGVNHKLSIYPGNACFGDRAVERYIGYCKCS